MKKLISIIVFCFVVSSVFFIGCEDGGLFSTASDDKDSGGQVSPSNTEEVICTDYPETHVGDSCSISCGVTEEDPPQAIIKAGYLDSNCLCQENPGAECKVVVVPFGGRVECERDSIDEYGNVVMGVCH